jgi:hypothetical protein
MSKTKTKNKTTHKKLVFPHYKTSEFTDGLIHGALLKYKKATAADVTAQIHAEVALLRAKSDVRWNEKSLKVVGGEK